MKYLQKRFFDVKRVLAVAVLFLCSVLGGFAQIDTEFWFAAPDITAGHNHHPILLCFASFSDSADVTISQPANPSFQPITVHLNSFDFYSLDLTNYENILETAPENTVTNYGLKIVSTSRISSYYQLCMYNSEIYTLKGRNALGTHFIVPIQNTLGLGYYEPEPRSSIEIVATQDNTTVTIIPGNAISGSTADTIVVVLNAGQTYSIRSVDMSAAAHLGNTVIISDKPVAVNSTDDSVHCIPGREDLAGEQIVPVDYAGNLFVSIWAEQNYDYETVTIFPTQNNTQIFIDNSVNPVATINVGQQYVYYHNVNLSAPITMIRTDKPVIVWQLSGYNCENGATQLPALECTGSREVVYGRPSISTTVIAYIVTKTVNISNFSVQCSNSSATLTAADFTQIPYDTAWSYCLRDFSSDVNNSSVLRVSNSSGKFHLGILDYDGLAMSLGYFCAYNNGGRIVFTQDEQHCLHSNFALTYFADDADSIQFVTPSGSVLYQDTLIISDFTASNTGTYYIRARSTMACDSLVWISDSIHLSLLPCEDPNYNPILPDNVDSADCTFLPTATEWSIGQPIISNVGNAVIVSTPMIGDVDDDGQQEIVIPSATNFLASQMNIYNADGTLKSQFNIAGTYVWNSVGLAKVKWQNNSFKTIIVVFGTDKYLYAYDANGTQLWQTNQPFTNHNGESYLMPAISFADFNHDGWSEVFIGSEVYDAATGVLLCKTDGNKGCSDRSWDWGNTPYQTMAADLFGDSRLELAVGNTVYDVDIQSRTNFSANHITVAKQLSSSAMTMEDGSQIPFTDGNTYLADINLDGSMDVIVMNVDGNNRVIYLYVWDVATSTIICSKKITNARKFGTPQIGDLDNNSYPEICFITGTYSGHGTGDNDMIYALKYNPSNSNGALDVFWSVPHEDNSGSTGLTMFDFNQDGYVELVYRDCNNLRIINGSLYDHQTGQPVSQPYNLAFISCHSATGIEYPVIADVDLDGEVEIVVGGETYSTDYGHLYIFKSAGVPWAPARKVWNQFLYNVTNINKDLTVPQYLFNNATPFTDPQGVVRRPFNNLLQQATTIDQYGRPFYAVPDVAVNPSASSQLIGYDTLALTFSYCNIGDNTLNAPYPITVFANMYGGDTLGTFWINQNLPVDSCAVGEIRLPTNLLCGIQNLDSLVIAVNCAGAGIAQNGSLQPECDTTNNTVTLSVEALSVSVTMEVEACDSYTWNDTTYNTSGTHTLMFTNAMGCDSIVTLQLTIHYSIETENELTICENDLPYTYGDTVFGIGTLSDSTYIFHRTTVHGCDSTSILHLTVNPTHLTEYADSVCQNMTYSGYGFSLSEDETGESGINVFDRTLTNQFGCDSVIRLNLYVKPVITPVFFANPDRAMLSENPVIHFVNATNTVELAQANYYWVWDFGDGTSDTTSEANTEHLYTQWGDYTVTLTLWADGCIDSASVTVFIEADLEFPNVITPNGDGINDVFVIKNLNPDRPNKLYITDRWGKTVWNQKNYQTYMKDEQIYNAESGFGMGNISDGVYYYTFYYEGMVRTVKFNGSITVIR